MRISNRYKIRNWIENWLHNRKLCVAKSEWLPVTSGIPLASVLISALFIKYYNDIEVNVSSSILTFADDTKLHSNVCTCDQMDHLQCDLDKM